MRLSVPAIGGCRREVVTVAMQVWSTDNIAERERFAVWREWRAAQLFGVTADLDREARPAFRASIASRPVGDSTLVELRASSYQARRTRQDIARVRADSLCIYQQVSGPSWAVEIPGRAMFVVPRLHIAFGYSDLPYATLPVAAEPFHSRLVKIPLTTARDPRGLRVRMRLPNAEPGLGALFSAYAQAFFANMTQLHGSAAETAVETLARLAMLAYDDAVPITETEGCAEAVAAGRLHLVQAFVRANLHRSDLSAHRVAREMRLSLRQLHRVFEPSGTSFARYVLTERVERVARALVGTPDRSILDIAFDCGFTGTSVFYRAFKVRFGMSPSDYRAAFANGRRVARDGETQVEPACR